MKRIIAILLSLITYCCVGQQRPTTLPTLSSSGFYKLDTGMLAKMQMFVEIDTFVAKNPTLIKHLNHNWYFTNGGGTSWKLLVDTSALSARINQKLNIADSITKYVTPTQLNNSSIALQDSINGKVNIKDSINKYVTPTALKDSLANIPTTDSLLTGGTITSIPTVGYVAPSHSTAAYWIQNVFYQSQGPTAGLSGGITLEFTTSGTQSRTLNWSGGRQSATQPLSTIVITGMSQTYPQTFSQPSAPGTVSGTQSVTITNNTTNTFTNTVTTSDGKIAIASATVNFASSAYYGFLSDTTNIGVFGTYNDALIRALTNVFPSTSKVFSFNSGAATSKFLTICYDATFGPLTNITINAIPSINTFSFYNRSFTNASGNTRNFYIYYTLNAQTTTGYPVGAN